MKEITFIHAADLHLDSPMTGLSHLPKDIFERLKDSSFAALRKIADAAIHYHVDFVILAGDLFDEQDRSVRAQTRLRKEMERLNAHQIQVYVVHGNHDHLNGTWVHLDMPENVHIFGGKVEVKAFTKPNAVTHLYGFSYEKRHVMENRMPEYSKKDGADFHIGILHGHHEGASNHRAYAPFRLKELMEKNFDYWALGHIHKRAILHENPYVIYPGNIQGRNKKETGKKGCYLVTMNQLETKLEFIDTASIQWEQLLLNGQEVNQFQELYVLCQRAIEEKRLPGKGVLLSIALQNIQLDEKELTSVRNGELLQALQEDEREEDSFVWPIKLEVEQSFTWDRSQLEKESEFYAELFRVSDDMENITGSISQLFEHPTAGKFLPPLSEKEKQELKNQALHTLVSLLHKN
ncbi:metallophosphoesterase family protein [Niallia endozanthoxylica]|uniref:DNA repair exonuclease n=1 Tax=Niallia endozanthoxylica TaxID=2036016 RepID=A0A5J5I762_9BACI|nr:DNA repair exonuclease [Niallia endozanthoxylica]KAA9031642.1 DNA repair exonuclease [Niallia endozanthoxylica]